MARVIGFTFFVSILTAFHAFTLHAEIVKDINITGNQRIGENIILSKLPFKVGDGLTNKVLNDCVKRLYRSEYF